MTKISADVPVTADAAKLDASIAAIKAKIAGLNESLSGLKMDADDKALIAKIAGLRLQAAQLNDALEHMTADVEIRAANTKILAIEAQIAVLENHLRDLKIGADNTAALEQLFALETELAVLTKKRSLVIGIDAVGALAGITTVKTALGALQKSVANIEIGVSDAAGLATLAGFTAKVNAITDKVNNLTVGMDIAPALAQILALQAAVTAFGASASAKILPADIALTELSRTVGVAGIGWANLTAKTQLFATTLTRLGVPAFLATASALHIIIDAALEIAAVVVPASIALGAFGLGAAPVIADIATQMKNVFNVSRALGTNIYPLTGGFQALAKAVQPEVYTLFGDGLYIVGQNMGKLQTLAVATGKVVDDLALRITAALTSGSFAKLLQNGPADLAKIGDVIGNIFGTIGNLFKSLPDYATRMLTVVDAFSKALESFSASPLVQFLTQVTLAGHGFLLWAGLAATVSVGLGNALLGLAAKFGLVAAGTTVFDAAQFAYGIKVATDGVIALGAEMVTLGAAEDIAAAGALTFEGIWAAITAISPIVWIGAILGGLAALVISIISSGNAVGAFGDTLNKVVSNSSLTTFGTTLTVAMNQVSGAIAVGQASISALNTQVANLPKSLTTASGGSGRFGAAMSQVSQTAQGLNAQLSAQQGILAQNQNELKTLQTGQANYNSLLKTAGGNLGLLNAAGITSNDILTASKADMARLTIEVQAQADAFKALSLGTGEQAAALNAMNIPLKENQAALQNLTQSESQQISIILGGRTAFNDFQQAIQGTTAKFVSPSGLADAAKLAGGNLTGLNAQSLAFSNTLYNQSIPAAQKMISALQMQGISQQGLTKVTATAAGQMLQYVGNNAEARSVIVDLINNALGPATVGVQNLDSWVGKNSTTLAGMNAIIATSTIQAGSLANVLNTQLTAAFQSSLFAASGAKGAVDQMTQAIINSGTGSATYRSARAQLIADLESTGIDSKTAATYVDQLQQSVDALHGKTIPLTTDSAAGKADISAFQQAIDAISQDKVPGLSADNAAGRTAVANLQFAINAITQGKIPSLTADSAAGRAAIAAFQQDINLIQQGKVPGLTADTAAGIAAVASLQGAINAIQGKTVAITVTSNAPPGSAARAFLGFAAGGIVHAAGGGQIPGSGNTDSVHALLTPGEVVVPKGMVRAGAVDHLKGKLPGFAAGGLAGSLAAGQGSEQGTYGALSSALSAGLANPTGYFATHKASLTGELGTLTKRQAIELSSYAGLAGKGLTAANLGKFGTALRGVGTVNADKYLSTAEPAQASALARALGNLEAVAAAGKTTVAKAAAAAVATTAAAAAGGPATSKSAAAIAAATQAAAAHAASAPKGGSAPESILTEAQYQADLSAVHGLTITDIRSSPHLTHLWHLLHEQHQIDQGLAKGGQVATSAVARVPRLVHDSGGWIPPGVSMSVNRTGHSEQVLPPERAGSRHASLDDVHAALLELIGVTSQQGSRFAGALNSTSASAAARGSYSARR